MYIEVQSMPMEPLRKEYLDDFHVRTRPKQSGGYTLCGRCEEYISTDLDACSYCDTPIGQSSLYEEIKSDKNPFFASSSLSHNNQKLSLEPKKSTSSSPMVYITSLLFLLIGGAFFFLGVTFPLIASDGLVTLSWNASSWSSFLGIGLLFITSGYLFLQKIPVTFNSSDA